MTIRAPLSVPKSAAMPSAAPLLRIAVCTVLRSAIHNYSGPLRCES